MLKLKYNVQNFSFSSKLEPEPVVPDLQTGSGRNIPAPQHCSKECLPGNTVQVMN